MDKRKADRESTITISDLYPHLNEDQRKAAEENLERYVGLVLRIYERIQGDTEAYARFKTLTAAKGTRYDQGKRSNLSPEGNSSTHM